MNCPVCKGRGYLKAEDPTKTCIKCSGDGIITGVYASIFQYKEGGGTKPVDSKCIMLEIENGKVFINGEETKCERLDEGIICEVENRFCYVPLWVPKYFLDKLDV